MDPPGAVWVYFVIMHSRASLYTRQLVSVIAIVSTTVCHMLFEYHITPYSAVGVFRVQLLVKAKEDNVS